MPIDLLKVLARFDANADRETDLAYFRTLVPSVAPYGYLNIVYKPQPPPVISEIHTELDLPIPLLEFFAAWNGARLFFGAVSVRGCLPRGQALNRADPFALLPFDIRETNPESQLKLRGAGLVRIGTYSFDNSIVCMNRTGQVHCCFGSDLARSRKRWASLDEWLTTEVERLSFFFDKSGICLVDDDESLLPGKIGNSH